MPSTNLFSSNLSATCHVGGYFSLKEGADWKMDTNTFGQNKFYYIKKGRCTLTIEGKEYEGIPGRWFFIPAGTRHSYINDKSQPFAKYWIHFDMYPDNTSFFDKLNLPYFTDIGQQEKIEQNFNLIKKQLKSESATDLFYGKSALFNLIAYYTQLTSPNAQIGVSCDENIEKIVSFVDENIERNIKLEELAAICHMHPTHFIRFFKKKTAETPLHFVQRRRIETAKRLIEETDFSMSEIMSRVGIMDSALFSKKFKLFYGSSPRDYRRNISNTNKAFDRANKTNLL